MSKPWTLSHLRRLSLLCAKRLSLSDYLLQSVTKNVKHRAPIESAIGKVLQTPSDHLTSTLFEAH